MYARGIVILMLALAATGCAQDVCCHRPGCALRSYCPYGYNLPAPPGKLGLRWWINHPHRGLLWGGPVDAPFIDPYWHILPWRNVGPRNQCGPACHRNCQIHGFTPVSPVSVPASKPPAGTQEPVPAGEPALPMPAEPMPATSTFAPNSALERPVALANDPDAPPLFSPPPVVDAAAETTARRVFYGNHMVR